MLENDDLKSDCFEFRNVQEIVNRDANATRIAFLSTAALLGCLFVVRLIAPLVDPTYPYISWSGFLLMSFLFGTFFWVVQFYTHRTSSFGPITPNTNFSYQNLADFLLSGPRVFGGSKMRSVDRAVGRISLSMHGIGGFVTVPWSKVRSVSMDAKRITIERNCRLMTMCKIFGTHILVLEFSDLECATRFYREAMSLVLARRGLPSVIDH